MATYTVEEQVQQLYVGLLGRPADATGFNYWVNDIKSGNLTLEQVRSNFVHEQPEGQAIYDAGNSREEIVAILYNNLFDREPGEGAQYWITGEGANVPADLLVYALIDGASEADRATLDQAVAEAQAQTDADQGGEEPQEPQEPSNPGENFVLTDGRDNVTGTSNDDTFFADAGQNQNGAIANAFATGDVIDGGAGRDKIVASIMDDRQVESGDASFINARTFNVEEAHFEAISLAGINGTVVVDAGKMDSVEEFWSDDSSANLVLDDVRLGSKLGVTKDITFGLRDVDAGAGLEAWFDSASLTNEGSSTVNSALVIRAADVSTETPETPLANVELEIGFTLGGERVDFTVQSTDGTYAGLAEAIKAALVDQGMGSLNVSLANPYKEVVFAGNVTQLPFTAMEVLITDPAGSEFANVSFQTANLQPVQGGFLLAGNAQPQDPSVRTTMIESNLILDNAGRTSTAGDVYIGGLSNSGKVVEKLNLTVDRSSKIDKLFTGFGREGNTAFQVIEVDSGAARGDLVIGDVGNVFYFDATAFQGQNLSVDGQAGTGDTQHDSEEFAYNYSHVYNTGASNDTINVEWSLDKAAEFTDYSLSVNTGAGNDTVHLISVNDPVNNLADQQDMVGDVVVNTGAGDDWVRTEGSGAVVISTGAGNDTIYTDNSGEQWMDGDSNAATWLVGAAETEITDLLGAPNALEAGTVLYGGEVLVTFSGAATGGGVTGGLTDGAAAYGVNGFESVADIRLPQGEVFGSRVHLNNAIKRAINDHEVLNKLLVASDGPNSTLVIRSLIDGEFAAEDLQINFRAATLDADQQYRVLGTNEKNSVQDALRELKDDSNYVLTETDFTTSESYINSIAGLGGNAVLATDAAGADLTGSASAEDNSFSVVDAGAGSNDVVVLSSNADSQEIVSITGYGNGKTTIVNFQDDSADPGVDKLDFQNYLTTMEPGVSGSVASQTVADYGVNQGSASGVEALEANHVTLIEFTGSATQAFGGISSANLIAALNGVDEFGNIGAATSFADTAGTYVGNTYKSVLMIENANNEGEYQAWDVTFGLEGGNTGPTIATGAELIGIYDFGASLDALSEANLVA